MIIYKCINCGKNIQAYLSDKRKFCDRKCRRQFSLITKKCLLCDKEFTRYRHLNIFYCSQKCSNSKGNHSKGGRIIETGGYIYIWQPHHPFAQKKGYVAEHRLVMEKKLGRFLTKEETIHHINGDRVDNRIENLKLFSNHSEHLKYHWN